MQGQPLDTAGLLDEESQCSYSGWHITVIDGANAQR
jgi:hypothetical protein